MRSKFEGQQHLRACEIFYCIYPRSVLCVSVSLSSCSRLFECFDKRFTLALTHLLSVNFVNV